MSIFSLCSRGREGTNGGSCVRLTLPVTSFNTEFSTFNCCGKAVSMLSETFDSLRLGATGSGDAIASDFTFTFLPLLAGVATIAASLAFLFLET